MRALISGVTWRSLSLVVVDGLLIVTAVLVAALVRFGPENAEIVLGWPVLWRALLVTLVIQLTLHYCDLYDSRGAHSHRDLIVGLLQALGAASLALGPLYYWIPELVIGRGVVLIASLLIITVIVVWRLTFAWLSKRLGPTERLLFVGTSGAAVELARELYERRNGLGVDLVGFIDADESRVGMPVLNPGVIGTIADIPRIVRERNVDRVVVSLADARGKFSMNDLLTMKLNDGVNFDHLASVYERYTGKIAIENLRPSWLIFSEGFRKSAALSASRRTLDIVLAAVGLLLLLPIMLIAGLAVRLSSKGPALYHQNRVGLRGRLFTVHKFRSMRQDAEAASGAVWSQANDPRVTGVGRLLRRTRIDELPQLWNVLRGDMSFVGPRPERPEFVSQLSEQIPFYGQRHSERPGLTGWAQVRHAYGATVDDALQKLQYDLYYIKHQSIAFDLFIILETIKTVVVRRGS
ncbi:MAG: TIGR03013 family XrtA/PEP-CTERM system glycosyltransferase [Vicinamibacteraceae bacterium]